MNASQAASRCLTCPERGPSSRTGGPTRRGTGGGALAGGNVVSVLLMRSLFQRKQIADLLPEDESSGGLKRALGTGDLVMLSIGAVIGAGIFSTLGTAAA